MADNEKGFWRKTWDVISYPFRQSGLADDITSTSLFPFKRLEELHAIPPSKMTEAEKEELAKLQKQNDNITKNPIGVFVERGTDAALQPLKDKFDHPALKFIKDHWQSITAILTAITVALTGGGIFGTIAFMAALVVVANDVVKSYTGKGILDHATEIFSSWKKDEHITKAPAKSKAQEVAAHAPAPTRSGEPLVPENPQPFPGEQSKWTEIAGVRKPLTHTQ